ncbi:MAG: DUF3788 family protein [Calditrichia bacterium]
MEPPILTSKDEFPTREIIFSHIGKSALLWDTIFDHIHTEYPDFSENWRYYKDGKSWLLKVARKSKTIFWLSIIKNAFRMTFYFTDRAEEAIAGSAISGALKEQFKGGKRYNKIRGITVILRNQQDVEDAKALLAIKLAIK